MGLGHQSINPGYMEPPSLRKQLRVPTINKEYIQECLRLPDQFLGACTLKEGTFVTLVVLQSVAVIVVTFLLTLLYGFPKQVEAFWIDKFKSDFDPYQENEEQELISRLWNMWDDITLISIGVHTGYFATGMLVAYALCKRNAHPFLYIPWLVYTGFMVFSCFAAATTMLFYLFYVAQYRNISVTTDWVPLIMVYVYAVFWFYGFMVSIAHYKRRRIVKFWKDQNKESLGNLY